MRRHERRLVGATCLGAILSVQLGCTSRYREPTLAATHPANPGAESGPLPERSRTLDLSDVDPVRSAAPADGMRHTGHGPMPGAAEEAGEGDGATQDGAPSVVRYTCPMHPEVTSKDPGRCPRCNMKLVEQQEGGEPR